MSLGFDETWGGLHTILSLFNPFWWLGRIFLSYNKEDADYKKWLGPEWTPQWSGSGTIVQNHINALCDILLSMYLFFPAFVAKKPVKKYPLVGFIAQAMDCIFLDRTGTKEEKLNAIK